jgi:hypothetical protein
MGVTRFFLAIKKSDFKQGIARTYHESDRIHFMYTFRAKVTITPMIMQQGMGFL